jgi:lipopolysaccharide/colanic/teichoic acid biosynthesis glycosyltransferase
MLFSTQNDTKVLNEFDFSYERTNMGFFYIGSDENLLEHFNQQFEFGYKQVNLYDAGKSLHQLYLQNNKLPDVLFIDLPFNEEELKHFYTRLKSNILLGHLPVIYIENHLTNSEIHKVNQLHIIDDVITINSNRINYCSKIMFLKQSKLYNHLFAAAKYRTKKKKNYPKSFSFILKRITDISLASLAILLLSPIILLIAIVIKLESKGPVFYTSPRAGKGFKIFKFYKFRSMLANADKEVDNLLNLNQYSISNNGPKFFKVNNDPRVTKFGKFLRNTSADELPQLLNVLKGDMSIVGNRPLPIYEAVSMTTNEFVERFSAPAGITGLWQVNKRGKADMSTGERISLDIAYSRYGNFFYDMKILAKTPFALFQKSDV